MLRIIILFLNMRRMKLLEIDFDNYKYLLKYVIIAVNSFIIFLKPTVSFILICFLSIIIDCFSAYRLSRRVRNKHKNYKISGKFESGKVLKIFDKLLIILPLIVLSFCIDVLILNSENLILSKGISGVFCLIEIWSILENESSCNNAKWAKIMQKYLIDKTSRHFDIDLDSLKEPKDNHKNS